MYPTGKLEPLTSQQAAFFGTVCLSKHPAAGASFYTQKMAGDIPAPGYRALVKPRPRSDSARQNPKTDAIVFSVSESLIVPR